VTAEPVPSTPTDEQPIAVVIAEAHRLIRAGLRVLLECEGDIVVVGEAIRGEHAVAEARRLRPNVVLLDIGLPGMDALRATRLIFDEGDAQVRVLLLATFGSDAEVLAALRAGAHGVLLRDSAPVDLRRAARTVAAGGALLTPGLTSRLAAELVSGRARDGVVPPELEVLTGREREVLSLVGHGFSNAEIAARLAVSPATVKTHVGGAIAKLDARDRAELVMLAYETGLVLPAARAGAPYAQAQRRRRAP
jgi:DNA-binding NarL/FixJ family response regulator